MSLISLTNGTRAGIRQAVGGIDDHNKSLRIDVSNVGVSHATPSLTAPPHLGEGTRGVMLGPLLNQRQTFMETGQPQRAYILMLTGLYK